MIFLADENFPASAVEVLRKAGWNIAAIAEICPGATDDEVARICSKEQRILLTFDKDFGELVFRQGLPAGSGIVLLRITLDSPEQAAEIALALIETVPDLHDRFCVITRDRIRVRPLAQRPDRGYRG